MTPEEIRAIEPTLRKDYYGGFYTPSDATGDIHKFTRGLAKPANGAASTFIHEANIDSIAQAGGGFVIGWADLAASDAVASARGMLKADGVVVCAGVASRHFAALLDERVNVYPVKGYSITVQLDTDESRDATPTVSLLDEAAKIVTSRLGADRFRVAGTAEFNDFNRDIRADRVQPLVDWVRSNFPAVETSQVVPWAGLRPMMPNMMPRGARRPDARRVLQHRPRPSRLDAVGRNRADDCRNHRRLARAQRTANRPLISGRTCG